LKNTTALVVAGNSKNERDIGVAPNFPKDILGQDEMITTSDFMNILGTQVGEHVNARFDLF